VLEQAEKQIELLSKGPNGDLKRDVLPEETTGPDGE
jgi:hypothetical protein